MLTLALWVGLELSRLSLPVAPTPPASRLHTLPVGPPRLVDPKTRLPLDPPTTAPEACPPAKR